MCGGRAHEQREQLDREGRRGSPRQEGTTAESKRGEWRPGSSSSSSRQVGTRTHARTALAGDTPERRHDLDDDAASLLFRNGHMLFQVQRQVRPDAAGRQHRGAEQIRGGGGGVCWWGGVVSVVVMMVAAVLVRCCAVLSYRPTALGRAACNQVHTCPSISHTRTHTHTHHHRGARGRRRTLGSTPAPSRRSSCRSQTRCTAEPVQATSPQHQQCRTHQKHQKHRQHRQHQQHQQHQQHHKHQHPHQRHQQHQQSSTSSTKRRDKNFALYLRTRRLTTAPLLTTEASRRRQPSMQTTTTPLHEVRQPAMPNQATCRTTDNSQHRHHHVKSTPSSQSIYRTHTHALLPHTHFHTTNARLRLTTRSWHRLLWMAYSRVACLV
jgi:hypothetical protein